MSARTRIWSHAEPFPDKVNFVDTNNVVLGYDLGLQCCEDAFWTISETPDGNSPTHRGDIRCPQEIELEGFRFDPSYFRRDDDATTDEYAVVFRLVESEGERELFVRLENHQNGYYSHGFTFHGHNISIDGDV
jgi:hypothetical protein